MNYEQFSQDVTATTAAKRTLDEFAKEQRDGVHLCPRCGQMTVKERLTTNAMSRHADVYICDACGTDEAVRKFKGNPLPLKDWAIAMSAVEDQPAETPRRVSTVALVPGADNGK